MRKTRLWSGVYKTMGSLYWAAGVCYVSLGLALKADTSTVQIEWVVASVGFLKGIAPISILILSGLLGIGKLIRGRIGSPRDWEMVVKILNSLQAMAFQANHGSDPPFEHRVTLFKAVRFWKYPMIPWPSKRYLVPYERSGHMTRKSQTYFKIDDRSSIAEGVAGRAWSTEQVVVVTGLPDINVSKKRQVIKKIAKDTWVGEEYVKKMKPEARSYCGIPIENRGVRWGVLVFDSRGENSISGSKASLEFTQVASILADLVARG